VLPLQPRHEVSFRIWQSRRQRHHMCYRSSMVRHQQGVSPTPLPRPLLLLNPITNTPPPAIPSRSGAFRRSGRRSCRHSVSWLSSFFLMLYLLERARWRNRSWERIGWRIWVGMGRGLWLGHCFGDGNRGEGCRGGGRMRRWLFHWCRAHLGRFRDRVKGKRCRCR
jgi:hypothetical protein